MQVCGLFLAFGERDCTSQYYSIYVLLILKVSQLRKRVPVEDSQNQQSLALLLFLLISNNINNNKILIIVEYY